MLRVLCFRSMKVKWLKRVFGYLNELFLDYTLTALSAKRLISWLTVTVAWLASDSVFVIWEKSKGMSI